MSDTTTNQIYRTPDGVWYQKRPVSVFICTGCMYDDDDVCHYECKGKFICLPYRPADDLAKIFEAFDRLEHILAPPDFDDEYIEHFESAATQAAKVRKMIEEFANRME